MSADVVLWRGARSGGEARVVIASHPAGERLEIERTHVGVRTSVAFGAGELDAVIVALQAARARLVSTGESRP